MTTIFDEPANQAGGIDSLKSIPVLLYSSKFKGWLDYAELLLMVIRNFSQSIKS
jgi:hypothetical protein